MGEVFTLREAAAFAPPERVTPSEWAEAYRFLPPSVAAESGRYRLDRTPYMRGILDALTEQIEELVILKAAQVGYTTTIQNMIGWIVDGGDPSPVLLVMPSEDAAGKLVEEQLRPLIVHTPRLAAHVADPSDITKQTIRFDTCSVYLGWSGSAQSLATRAIKTVFLDECDKYPAFSGKDADPLNLARARTRTYGHRKRVVIGSTPTTREGHIWKCWEGCGDRRFYYVSCPFCSDYQRLIFPQIQFGENEEQRQADKVSRAESIEARQSAYYECSQCHEHITDAHKPSMLSAGLWLSEEQTVVDGKIVGDGPKAKRVGFQISALYSPWVSFSALAAQFLRAAGDSGALMEFRNQWLAEVHEDIAVKVKVDELRQRVAKSPPPLVVPPWAGLLLASADVHAHEIHYVVRAWGNEYRSQLIAHGKCLDFEALRRVALNAYRIGESQDYLTPIMLVIDAGFRTDEVYQFAQTDGRIVAIKGASQAMRLPYFTSKYAGSKFGIALQIIDTSFYKDRLATLRAEQLEDGTEKWGMNNAVTDEYLRQQGNEHKIRGKNGKLIWLPVTEGAPCHFGDCEVYQCFGAELANVKLIPPQMILEQQRAGLHHLRQQRSNPRKMAAPAPHGPPAQTSWLGTGSKWL